MSEPASKIRAFVAEQGGPAVAVIEYIGRVGFRLVVVAGNGRFVDAVLPDEAAARATAESAGVPIGSWDRELSARVTVSPQERRQMAGTGR